MTVTTLSSREFNQDTGKAKKAARKGPVFITDRGEPSLVLMSMDAYRELIGRAPSVVELLAFDGDVDDRFDRVLEEARLGVVGRPATFD